MRRVPFVALLLGVVLLSAGLLAMTGAVAQERQRDKTLQHDAAQVASAFSSYFERARSLDLLLAQSPAFRPPPGQPIDNEAANRALIYLERLYPGAISEACLIDDRGHELARVTEGVAAPVADLSSTESQNAFFAPTLSLGSGEVYQAPPYVSPDTHEWVISNSTRVRQPNGHLLIVHFEVSLASFRPLVIPNSTGGHVAVVERTTGRTVLEDDIDLPATSGEQFPSSPAASYLTSGEPRPSTVTVDDQRVAMDTVTRAPGNANDWTVLEWPTGRASFVPPWAGGGAAGAGAALILLFLFILQRQHSTLRKASRLDHLTGLANRRAAEEALDKGVAAAAQPGGGFVAVLMLDLDGFKQINDALGHDKGDLVLQEIGRRLHANTFEYDTAARVGGDEFAVVLRQLRGTDDVAAVAHRLREALVRPFTIDGVARFVGVSVGAAIYGEHGTTSEDLMRSADAAMYDAKRGREGVRVYDAGTTAGAKATWLAAELLIAIENAEITLAFQPEFDLGTGRIIGVEALARWTRDGVPIPPVDFVALAEHVGLIRPLTLLTLRRALDEAKVWQAAGTPVPVSVNLSGQLVSDRHLQADISAMLAARGLTGDVLVLEITETTVVKNVRVATEVLGGLRAIGIRIEMDDFGSGYASFKSLHELPLDGVKIDRSLVEGLGAGGQSLLAATIEIGRRLGLTVVAEGIEDEPGLALVRRLGADTGQGYHLARPMSPEAVRLLLSEDSTAPARRP